MTCARGDGSRPLKKSCFLANLTRTEDKGIVEKIH